MFARADALVQVIDASFAVKWQVSPRLCQAGGLWWAFWNGGRAGQMTQMTLTVNALVGCETQQA